MWESFADLFDLRLTLRRFDKQHVSASIGIRFGARDCRIETFNGDGVGSRDDHQVGVACSIPRGTDFLHHLPKRND